MEPAARCGQCDTFEFDSNRLDLPAEIGDRTLAEDRNDHYGVFYSSRIPYKMLTVNFRGCIFSRSCCTISPKGIVQLWSWNKAVANVFPHKAEPSSATRTGQHLLDCWYIGSLTRLSESSFSIVIWDDTSRYFSLIQNTFRVG